MLYEIQLWGIADCILFVVAAANHSKACHKTGKALYCELDESQNLIPLERCYNDRNNTGAMSYSPCFMRKFGLIDKVMSEYPDHELHCLMIHNLV